MTQQLPLFPQLSPGPPAREQPRPRRVKLRQAAAEYLPTVKDLPPGERPKARLEAYGSGALSTAELLAVLIGTPHQVHDAERLLSALEGLLGIAQATRAYFPGDDLLAATRARGLPIGNLISRSFGPIVS